MTRDDEVKAYRSRMWAIVKKTGIAPQGVSHFLLDLKEDERRNEAARTNASNYARGLVTTYGGGESEATR